MKPLLAHVDQTLISHLEGVSHKAEVFSSAFAGTEQGKLAGLLHDIGKAEPEFQKRIHSNDTDGDKQPHAHHGAAYALRGRNPVQFPVADFRELTEIILSHGTDIEVLHQPEMKLLVKEEIDRMTKIYQVV